MRRSNRGHTGCARACVTSLPAPPAPEHSSGLEGLINGMAKSLCKILDQPIPQSRPNMMNKVNNSAH